MSHHSNTFGKMVVIGAHHHTLNALIEMKANQVIQQQIEIAHKEVESEQERLSSQFDEPIIIRAAPSFSRDENKRPQCKAHKGGSHQYLPVESVERQLGNVTLISSGYRCSCGRTI